MWTLIQPIAGLGLILLAALLPPAPALAGTEAITGAPPDRQSRIQDLDRLGREARVFLLAGIQAAHPGLTAQVETGPLDPRLRLPHCPTPEYTLTAGGTPHGSGSLAVRCTAPNPWTLYLGYRVTLTGEVLVARRPLPARAALQAADLELRRAELTRPPGHYFRLPDALRGSVLARAVAAGQPITLEVIRRQPAVRASQRVRLVSEGAGFQVSQEGTAQNAAYVGETVRVKMPSGRIIQGVAEADGSVRAP